MAKVLFSPIFHFFPPLNFLPHLQTLYFPSPIGGGGNVELYTGLIDNDLKRHLLSLNRHVNLNSISLLQLLIFYEEHVAPLVATIHEKSHCVFCHLFDSASEFYRERFLPAVTLAWARISQWCQRTYKDAMVVFEAKVLPTLIIIR